MQKGQIEPKKPIKFYTASTPNGLKVSILLEELKEQYSGFQYETIALSFDKNEQKEPSFLAINPNGRIPAIVDPNAEYKNCENVIHYDPEGHFHFRGQAHFESEIIQWMSFVHGQCNHFVLYAPEKIQYGIDRYTKETLRLYSVLGDRLKDRDFLVGEGKGKFSIADMNAFPWVLWSPYCGIYRSQMPKNVVAWVDRILARSGIKAGLDVPSNNKINDMCADPDFESKHAEDIKKEAAQHTGWVQKGNK